MWNYPNLKNKPAYAWLAAVLILIGINWLWGRAVYLGHGVPATKDLVLSFQPTHADLARQGWPPYRLMEPRNGFGIALLAESQASQFYPPGILARWLLDPDTGIFTLMYLHLLLAGVFTLLFARVLGLSFPAGIFAAIAYMGSSFMVYQLDAPPILYQATLLPAVAAGVSAHFKSRRMLPLVLAGIALGLQTLAGHFQVGFFTIVFVAGLSLFHSRHATAGKRYLPALKAMSILLCIATGIAWVQIRSTLSFLPQACRNGLEESFWLSWPPYQIITLFQPFLFGMSSQTFLGGALPPGMNTYWGAGVYWVNGFYVGVGALVTAIISLRLRREPVVKFLWCCLLGILLLAAGKYFFLNDYIYRLPLVDKFRFPARMLVLACLVLAILSGFGLDHLTGRSDDGGLRRYFTALGLGVLLAYGLICAAWAVITHADGLAPAWLAEALHHSKHTLTAAATLHPLNGDNLKALTLGTAVLLLAWFRQQGKIAARPFVGLMLILAIVDMTGFVERHQLFTAPSFYKRKLVASGQVVAELSKARIFSIARYHAHPVDKQLDLLPPSINLRTSLSIAGFRGSLFGERYFRYYNALCDAYLGDDIQIEDEYVPLDLFRLADIGFFIRREPLTQRGVQLVGGSAGTRIYRITGTLKRVRWVPGAVYAPDAAAAWKYITDPARDKLATVVVEDGAGRTGTNNRQATGVAQVLAATAGYFKIAVTAESPGYVTIADTWHRGWRAAIDGRSARVMPANYLFMAVRVPAGEHILELRYAEPCLGEGLIGLGLTALLMAGLLRRNFRGGFTGPANLPSDPDTTMT